MLLSWEYICFRQQIDVEWSSVVHLEKGTRVVHGVEVEVVKMEYLWIRPLKHKEKVRMPNHCFHAAPRFLIDEPFVLHLFHKFVSLYEAGALAWIWPPLSPCFWAIVHIERAQVKACHFAGFHSGQADACIGLMKSLCSNLGASRLSPVPK